MTVNIEQLMERVGDLGAVIILKVDGERGPGDVGRWTFVVSDRSLSEQGSIRIDAPTLHESLARGLALLRARGEEWHWLDEFTVF